MSEDASDVVTLTDANFEEESKKHQFLLIEFYAPWCGHCKQLAPEYEKAATELKKFGAEYGALAKIDADSNRKTGEKFGIQGFPTLKLFRNGVDYKEYDGGRTAADIVAWMKKKTGPVAKLLNTQEEVDAFVKQMDGKALIFYGAKDDEKHKQFLSTVTSDKAFDDFPAAEVFNEELVKAQGSGSVKLVRTNGEPLTYTGEFSELKQFVVANGYPLVEEISAANFQRFAESGLPLGVVFIDYSKTEEKEVTLKTVTAVAEKLKGKFMFAYSDGVEYKDQITSMGADASKLPVVAAMNIELRVNYPYSGELEVDALTKWAEGIVSGEVKPFYKSDPIPETNDGPVTVIVGKSFESIVLDESKDVLVEFYAPWCGHCKSLEPKYNKLGEEMKKLSSNVVIGKVDATTNDTPVPVEGFPTIIFFPKGNKKTGIPYEGARTEEAMIQFIKENAVAAKADFANTTEEKKKDEL
eukprot:gene7248-11566_t